MSVDLLVFTCILMYLTLLFYNNTSTRLICISFLLKNNETYSQKFYISQKYDFNLSSSSNTHLQFKSVFFCIPYNLNKSKVSLFLLRFDKALILYQRSRDKKQN